MKKELIRRLKTWAEGQQDVVALYLFGSQVAGNTHPTSDLDVGVLARPEVPKERLWRLGDRWAADRDTDIVPHVDLVLLNLTPVSLRFESITRRRLGIGLWWRRWQAKARPSRKGWRPSAMTATCWWGSLGCS